MWINTSGPGFQVIIDATVYYIPWRKRYLYWDLWRLCTGEGRFNPSLRADAAPRTPTEAGKALQHQVAITVAEQEQAAAWRRAAAAIEHDPDCCCVGTVPDCMQSQVCLIEPDSGM